MIISLTRANCTFAKTADSILGAIYGVVAKAKKGMTALMLHSSNQIRSILVSKRP